jgi:5-methylcytosine-specific restriction endonuclease McrA
MATFKALVTINWKVESKNPEDCVQVIRKRLETLIGDHSELTGFNIQVDLAPMKERKYLQHIASYTADEILSLVTEKDCRMEFIVNDTAYWVRMNSDRYLVFRNSRRCASCGIEGTKIHLDLNPGDSSPHFNLYAEEGNKLILMTKDHRIPKSKGGQNTLDNYVTMCSVCNNLKGNSNLTYQQVGLLRQLFANEKKLSRKELRELINKTREDFVEYNEFSMKPFL